MQEEAEEHYQRTKSQPGTIIGRPAGREAYTGQSAMRYEQQSRDGIVQETQKGDKSQGQPTY
jgi:hypothetical protein